MFRPYQKYSIEQLALLCSEQSDEGTLRQILTELDHRLETTPNSTLREECIRKLDSIQFEKYNRIRKRIHNLARDESEVRARKIGRGVSRPASEEFIAKPRVQEYVDYLAPIKEQEFHSLDYSFPTSDAPKVKDPDGWLFQACDSLATPEIEASIIRSANEKLNQRSDLFSEASSQDRPTKEQDVSGEQGQPRSYASFFLRPYFNPAVFSGAVLATFLGTMLFVDFNSPDLGLDPSPMNFRSLQLEERESAINFALSYLEEPDRLLSLAQNLINDGEIVKAKIALRALKKLHPTHPIPNSIALDYESKSD